MMNIRADEIPHEKGFAYIEEFRRGKYMDAKYKGLAKQMTIQIYFSRFSSLHSDASEREKTREKIENEIVREFMDKYNHSGRFEYLDEFALYYPLPRFDANEVSVMLEFNCIMLQCKTP